MNKGYPNCNLLRHFNINFLFFFLRLYLSLFSFCIYLSRFNKGKISQYFVGVFSPQSCHICEEKNKVRSLGSKQSLDVVRDLGVFEINFVKT